MRRLPRIFLGWLLALCLVCGVAGCAIAIVDDEAEDGGCLEGQCNQPPAPTCVSASTLRTYSSAGMCAGGSCSYAQVDTSCGTITIGLNAAQFPVSVNNFVFLAQQKFYDGLDFARAAKGFTIQGGSPTNNQEGGPGYSVVGEVPTSSPAYPVGSFAMAKGGDHPAGTAESQFFIITGKNTLTADYAYVGTVTKGLDVAKKIASFAPANGDGPPTTTVKINKVTITVTPSATTTTAAPTTTVAP